MTFHVKRLVMWVEKLKILVLKYKKRGDHESMFKTFHSSARLITNSLGIGQALESMHQRVMEKK